jgi:hypothetical protein
MMTSSVVNLLQTKHTDTTDELTTMLESLPSYENSQETQDESAVFDDALEPSTGLINLIRKNSLRTSQIGTTNDLLHTVRIILK